MKYKVSNKFISQQNQALFVLIFVLRWKLDVMSSEQHANQKQRKSDCIWRTKATIVKQNNSTSLDAYSKAYTVSWMSQVQILQHCTQF